MGFLLLLVLLILGVCTLLLVRHRDAAYGAQLARRLGFGVMVFAFVVFVIFAVGETLSDPGGWAAVRLIVIWLVPLVALAALSWFRPNWASRVLIVFTAAALGLVVWAAAASSSVRVYEDDHGPVRAITVFVLSAVLAVLGLKRTRIAGLLLTTLCIVPLVLSTLGHHAGGSLVAAASPGVVTGILYLVSASRTSSRARPVQAGSWT